MPKLEEEPKCRENIALKKVFVSSSLISYIFQQFFLKITFVD